MARPVFLLLGLALLAGRVSAGPLNVACEDLTRVEFCTECTNVGGQAKCLQCHKDKAPAWGTDGRVTSCKTTTFNAASVTASGDTNCAQADGQWCVLCKPNFFFNKDFLCVTSSAGNAAAKTLENCRGTSKNPKCAACNPDGTCSRCNAGLILMPLNAAYINAGWRDSKCLSVADLNKEAKSITWVNAVVPTGCLSVDSDFKCDRCADTQSLVNGKCVAVNSGSKCANNVPYRQYCSKCSPANKCATCNGSRSLVNGACSLPCKLLYGIGCKVCNATRCITRDDAYKNGRK